MDKRCTWCGKIVKKYKKIKDASNYIHYFHHSCCQDMQKFMNEESYIKINNYDKKGRNNEA